jgi:RHS repeat-associated protein
MEADKTQYLYGNLSNPFQVTASRAPDNVLTVYYYDDYGALYALERGGVRYYVGSDHLGTPKVVTDNTGNIVRQIEYDAWGVKTRDTNPGFDLPVGFAGGIPDDATGLVRFGFRDYEPGTGRWMAKDPIFFKSGQLNLFGYALNDPVNKVDSTGLAPAGLGFFRWWLIRVGVGAITHLPFTVGAGIEVFSPKSTHEGEDALMQKNLDIYKGIDDDIREAEALIKRAEELNRLYGSKGNACQYNFNSN